ncbi:MAG: hypothetical protein M1840_002040 [Geoglossum simile]|nr:MAG: hypothetical protein M1840_002040 [Geoglossum simile]
MATLYTAAANALGRDNNVWTYGVVKTQFANSDFTEAQCLTQMKSDTDYETCLQIWHAGRANPDYLISWATLGSGSSDLGDRPAGVGPTHNDTNVQGSWVDVADIRPAIAGPRCRIINNVTTPRAGVVAAAQDPKNGILHPDNMTGLREYTVVARVATAAVNVTCVEMTKEEFAPLVFGTFPLKMLGT